MAVIHIRRVDQIRPTLDEFKKDNPHIYAADSRAIEHMVLNYSRMSKELAAAKLHIEKLQHRLEHYNDDKARLSEALQPFLVALEPNSRCCKNCAVWDFKYVQRGVAVGGCLHLDNEDNTTNEMHSCKLHETI